MAVQDLIANCISSDSAKWTDVVQAVSVPVSLFVSWLIFKAGQNSELIKQRGNFLLDCADQCEKEINRISSDARTYFINPPAGSEKLVLEVEINSSLKQLSRLLSRLSNAAGKESHYFFDAHGELKACITGSDTQFASQKRGKLKPDDPKIAMIIGSAHKLATAIEGVRTEYLGSSKPNLIVRR